MKNNFQTIAIFVTAAIWIGFAIWIGTSPQALLAAFGIESSTPAMLTEIRAFYGGVELAIGIAMVVLWWRNECVAALIAGGLPLVGSAGGRCLGMVLDGFSLLHAGFAGFELFGAIICVLAIFNPATATRQTP